jgi:hypothetical protein
MVLLLLAACGAPKGSTPGGAPAALPPVLPPRPLAQVFVLEASGAAPEDTVVTVIPGAARVIVLRRSAPDFGLFARLELRPGADTAARAGPPTAVTLLPTPGLYSLTLAFQGAVADSATITFSYGTHFVAPAGARERYGSNLAFEKALAIGRVGDDGVVTFLPTSRPGSDMVRAPVAGPGRYLVAAPR